MRMPYKKINSGSLIMKKKEKKLSKHTPNLHVPSNNTKLNVTLLKGYSSIIYYDRK
jgi:hypothetical protein